MAFQVASRLVGKVVDNFWPFWGSFHPAVFSNLLQINWDVQRRWFIWSYVRHVYIMIIERARLFHQVLFPRALFLDKFEKSPILWLFVGDFYVVTSAKQIHLTWNCYKRLNYAKYVRIMMRAYRWHLWHSSKKRFFFEIFVKLTLPSEDDVIAKIWFRNWR